MQFNFARLHGIFSQAVRLHRTTVAFEVQSGVGRFVFMMFLAEEDGWTAEKRLFLYLGRTRRLLSPYKLYGNQSQGSFKIYPHSKDEHYIKNELGIEGGLHPFDLERFLGELNAGIPETLPFPDQVATLRRNRQAFIDHPELRDQVDGADRIYLIGPVHLPANKSPKEKTLRKLSMHVEAEPQAVEELIARLKKANVTLQWTDDPDHARMGFNQLITAF